jgi:hypothetical protein
VSVTHTCPHADARAHLANRVSAYQDGKGLGDPPICLRAPPQMVPFQMTTCTLQSLRLLFLGSSSTTA